MLETLVQYLGCADDDLVFRELLLPECLVPCVLNRLSTKGCDGVAQITIEDRMLLIDKCDFGDKKER